MTDKMEKALQLLADRYCRKILRIDLDADSFEILTADEDELAAKAEQQPSDRLSDWLSWFADSPLCHDRDRARLRRFIDPAALRQALCDPAHASAGIVYRRKLSAQDRVYSTVSLDIIPTESSGGHLTGYLIVRDITGEINRYNAGLAEASELRSPASGQKTLLIIEDNELNRELLTEILSDSYHVLQAENGAVGLELLQQHMTEISLILLDIHMPVMNGYEFLEAVRRDPFLSGIPVVVETGSNFAEEEGACLALGASDFVLKPYNADIIRSRISGIIRLRESAATLNTLQIDERTGLYTLQAFYYHAGRELLQESGRPCSLILFDVDHFKLINESYGEAAGDRLLRQIADEFKKNTVPSDVYGYFGAGTFLILKQGLTRADADAWVAGLFHRLKEVIQIKGISFKAGIYDSIDRSIPISAACDRAISALKSVGQDFDDRCAHYDASLAERERRLSTMESEMREAYSSDQFLVYYQPKHDARSGRLVGAEALVRWKHPQYGFLSPAEFIPLFEKNGFISYVDYYVFRRSCKNLRKWMNEGIDVIPISINISRRDFEREHHMKYMQQALARNAIDPSQIHLEVTESIFSDKLEELSQILQECRDAGFMVELDDFGSGYSSLTTLASLPLDVLKLDMSFMKNIGDERKMKVLATCIALGKSLGLKIIAEGVETAEQAALLQRLGCDWIQGYYYSRPLPEEEFRAYLLRHTGSRK